ncbi:hypothetical protein BG452_10750 [Streptomyces sp. CBMA123]|nr:hypothetical protein [Streptomyces sp. CBMA123]
MAKRMRADFEQSRGFKHNASAGGSRELIAHGFVDRQLPGHIKAICGAEIATAAGDVSPQCDILLADRSTPPLTHLEGYQVVPNECVYGVIEVKTTLDGNELADACEKIRKVKAMPKTAYFPYPTSGFPPHIRRYGKIYPYMPTVGMIFAFDSINLDTLGDHFHKWCAGREPHERPDSVWVLGKGSLIWADPVNGLINVTPEQGSSLLASDPPPNGDILLSLALNLNALLAGAWIPPLRLLDYARQHPLGVNRRTWTDA